MINSTGFQIPRNEKDGTFPPRLLLIIADYKYVKGGVVAQIIVTFYYATRP